MDFFCSVFFLQYIKWGGGIERSSGKIMLLPIFEATCLANWADLSPPPPLDWLFRMGILTLPLAFLLHNYCSHLLHQSDILYIILVTPPPPFSITMQFYKILKDPKFEIIHGTIFFESQLRHSINNNLKQKANNITVHIYTKLVIRIFHA